MDPEKKKKDEEGEPTATDDGDEAATDEPEGDEAGSPAEESGDATSEPEGGEGDAGFEGLSPEVRQAAEKAAADKYSRKIQKRLEEERARLEAEFAEREARARQAERDALLAGVNVGSGRGPVKTEEPEEEDPEKILAEHNVLPDQAPGVVKAMRAVVRPLQKENESLRREVATLREDRVINQFAADYVGANPVRKKVWGKHRDEIVKAARDEFGGSLKAALGAFIADHGDEADEDREGDQQKTTEDERRQRIAETATPRSAASQTPPKKTDGRRMSGLSRPSSIGDAVLEDLRRRPR